MPPNTHDKEEPQSLTLEMCLLTSEHRGKGLKNVYIIKGGRKKQT